MALGSLADPVLLTTAADPPLSHNFAVMLDGIPAVHMWTSVQGLSLSLQSAGSRGKTGSTPHHVKQAATAGSSNGSLTLTRPLGPASQSIYEWCDKSNTRGHAVKKTNGIVILLDRTGMLTYTWELTGIVPTGWSVSTLDASKGEIVTETLKVSYSTMKFSVSPLD